MCCLKSENFAWIKPPTSCVFHRVITTQPVNFCKIHDNPKLVYISKILGVKNKKVIHKNLQQQFVVCFQNFIEIWSFGENFDFSIVETAEQQSLDIRAKRFRLRHPQVVGFVYLFHALFELTYSLQPFKQAITGVPTRPRGLLLWLPPTPTSEQPGGIWTLTPCKGEKATASQRYSSEDLHEGQKTITPHLYCRILQYCKEKVVN